MEMMKKYNTEKAIVFNTYQVRELIDFIDRTEYFLDKTEKFTERTEQFIDRAGDHAFLLERTGDFVVILVHLEGIMIG